MENQFDKKLKIQKEGANAMSLPQINDESASAVKAEGETKKSVKTVKQSIFKTQK